MRGFESTQQTHFQLDEASPIKACILSKALLRTTSQALMFRMIFSTLRLRLSGTEVTWLGTHAVAATASEDVATDLDGFGVRGDEVMR